MSYRMPAEWEEHAACWMAWPCRKELWSDLSSAREAYTQVALAISQFEPVIMVCNPEDSRDCAMRVGQFVELVVWPINDSWTRDSGPTFVRNADQQLAVVDWQFNGWGNRFKPFCEDAQFARRVADYCHLPVIESSLVAEGGAIHVDGQGTLLTTRQCLLNPNRNPGISQADIADEFTRHLGASKTIWLEEGLKDDHTDGHVDELACFVEPGHVVTLLADDSGDDNFSVLQANYQQLSQETDAVGNRLKVTAIQQPEPRYLSSGERMSLSYINFYLPNDGVVMAEFNQPDYDRAAKECLQTIFPQRNIIQIPALEIFSGGGGIHCITQQQPKI